ncbi:MAG: RloB family protein [Pseudomonadota bacterium]|nr:RloB family protein [Pseudomonadota bacterium]
MATRKKSPSRTANPSSYYFIVEGCSEENYIQCLKKILKSRQVAKPKNCNGGGAKAVLQQANKLIEKYKNDYLGFVIWFDKDTCSQDKEAANIKKKLAQQHNVALFITDPCFEHWLLAHFQTIHLNEQQTCQHYENKLKSYIINYQKNNCHQLEQHLSLEKIKTAVQNYPDIGELCKKYF